MAALADFRAVTIVSNSATRFIQRLPTGVGAQSIASTVGHLGLPVRHSIRGIFRSGEVAV